MSTPTPTAKVGLNTYAINSGCADVSLANVLRSADQWMTTRGPAGAFYADVAHIDANGCPTEDANAVIVSGEAIAVMQGTYLVQFTGQGIVTYRTYSEFPADSTAYNAATNTTTAAFTVGEPQNQPLQVFFRATRRLPTDPPPSVILDGAGNPTQYYTNTTGITNPYVMRPIAPGATTSHAITENWTREFVEACRPFKAIRTLDTASFNNYGDQPVAWEQRLKPTDLNQGARGGVIGGICYELQIELCNLIGADLRTCIPIMALRQPNSVNHSTTYVTKLAQCLFYGTDATGEPYTGPAGSTASSPVPQSGPVYPPLGKAWRFEIANEVWNFVFPGSPNNASTLHNLAALEIQSALPGTCDLNSWDNLQDFYVGAIRLLGSLTYEASMICQSVMGLANLGVKYFPVLMGQQSVGTSTFQPALDWFAHNAPSTPVNQIICAIGGGWYENLALEFELGVDSLGNMISIDQAVGVGLGAETNWDDYVTLAVQYGIQIECYEGGLNYVGPAQEEFPREVSLDPRFLRYVREVLDRGFQKAAAAGVSITVIVYGSTQASWGIWRQINSLTGTKWATYVQAISDWAGYPTDGSSTAPMPPIATVTGLQLSQPTTPILGGATVKVPFNLIGQNAPILAVSFNASQSSIDASGTITLPPAASVPQQVIVTGTAVSNSVVTSSITLTIPAATVPAAPPILDPSFELYPGLDPISNHAFVYNAVSRYWTFTGQAGISTHNGDIARSNPTTGYGNQLAFIQTAGSMSQTVPGWVAGTYQLGFVAAQRNYFVTENQTLAVFVDNVQVGTFAPPTQGQAGAGGYAPYQTNPFPVAAGNHTIRVQGLATDDETALVDNVTLTLVTSFAKPVGYAATTLSYGRLLQPAGLV